MSYEIATDIDFGPNLTTSTTNEPKVDHFIKIYDKVVSDDLCQELITHLESSNRFVDHDYLRRHEAGLYPNQGGLFQKLVEVIRSNYQRYKQEIGVVSSNLYQCNSLEYPTVVSYQPSNEKKEHFYDHADGWHFDSCSRQISMILYLSDVEEGGTTTFDHLNLSVHPQKGRMLIFPSNFIYRHRADPPISGTKYVCICWLHFDGKTTYGTLKI
jgi:hypothetical protein